jgi:hypothetical protein
LDDILASACAKFLRRKQHEDISNSDPLSTHQAFLLALSDQSLVTGIGSLIALYAQMCNGLSTFSFQLGIHLALFCAGVHLNTLMALQVYLRNNPKQAMARALLMVIFLILILPSIALRHVSYWCFARKSAACCIRTAGFESLELGSINCLDWIGLVVLMIHQYYCCILDLRPRAVSHRLQEQPRHAPIPFINTWIPWAAVIKADVASARLRRQEKAHKAGTHAARRLWSESRHPQLHLLRIMAPYVWHDTFDSLIAVIFCNSFWFISSMADTWNQLNGDVDIEPLLSWKYGQVMPVLSLLVYLLVFLEAKPSEFIEPLGRLLGCDTG